MSRFRKTRSRQQSSSARRCRPRVEKLEDRRLLAVVAADGFESANFSGGTEQWAVGQWDVSGDATIRSDTSPASGNYHTRLRRNTGDLQRTVDVSGLTDVRLQFSSKLISFEGSDRADVKVSGDGTNWTTIKSFFNGDDDGQYHDYDLAVPDVGDTLHIRFDAGMSGSGDYWYIDNVQLTGAQGGPPTVSINDAGATEGGSAWGFADAIALDADGTNVWSWGLTKGQGDNLYATFSPVDGNQTESSGIARINSLTGDVDRDFVPVGSSGLEKARELEAHGGWIYVGNKGTNEILRFDEVTGAADPSGAFVSSNSGGLATPRGIVFDNAGDLLVSSKGTDAILKFSGADGTFLGVFASNITGGGTRPKDLAFDAANHLVYVAGNDQLFRYNAIDGTLLSVISATELTDPAGVETGADGYLYTTNASTDQILQFDVQSDSLQSTIEVDPVYGEAVGLAFDNAGSLYTATHLKQGEVVRFAPSSSAVFTVALSASSNIPVSVEFDTSDTSAEAGRDYVATTGVLTFEPGVTTRTIIVPTLDDSDVESDETFIVNLSNAVGATIADGSAVGTIIDDEVPNLPPAVDAGADQTLNDADASGVALVTLVGTASDSDGSVASVQWTEGATVLGNATALTTSLAVGVHTLTFTAIDNDGASSSDTVVVTVNPNQGPTADAGSNITVSDADDNGSELVTLTGAGSDMDGTIASYQWSEGSTVLGTSSSISPALTVGTHVLTLTVTDNGGATASDTVVVTVEPASSETALFVYDIRFESFWGGRYRRAIFEIRSDSNGDGQGSSADAAAAGVAITVQFDGRTYSGTTDSNGLFVTSWRKNVSNGTYAEVVDLALTDFTWDPLALDLEDDTDGDGLPDATV